LILGTAARIWGFRGFGTDPIRLALPGKGTRLDLPFDVHRYGGDSLIHTTKFEGLRLTTIPKTVMDLLGQRDRRAPWVLDRSLIDRSCTLAEYWLLHDDPEMKWHRGRRLLRERLKVRSQRPPNESTGERKLWRLMMEAPGLTLPVRQFWLTFPGGERIRFDFAYEELRFAIEVDDYGTHGPEDSFGKDRRRDSECALLGWFVLRIPEGDIDSSPDVVIETIRAHINRLTK
jgi:very-short-patch-repair endonuclease